MVAFSEAVLGALLALGGVAVSGAVGTLNEWAQRRAAHRAWLRERRSDAYATMLLIMRRIADDLSGLAMDPAGPLPRWQKDGEVEAALTAVNLYGSREARQAFEAYDSTLAPFWMHHYAAQVPARIIEQHAEDTQFDESKYRLQLTEAQWEMQQIAADVRKRHRAMEELVAVEIQGAEASRSARGPGLNLRAALRRAKRTPD